jgi:hypothetical protein
MEIHSFPSGLPCPLVQHLYPFGARRTLLYRALGAGPWPQSHGRMVMVLSGGASLCGRIAIRLRGGPPSHAGLATQAGWASLSGHTGLAIHACSAMALSGRPTLCGIIANPNNECACHGIQRLSIKFAMPIGMARTIYMWRAQKPSKIPSLFGPRRFLSK